MQILIRETIYINIKIILIIVVAISIHWVSFIMQTHLNQLKKHPGGFNILNFDIRSSANLLIL